MEKLRKFVVEKLEINLFENAVKSDVSLLSNAYEKYKRSNSNKNQFV